MISIETSHTFNGVTVSVAFAISPRAFARELEVPLQRWPEKDIPDALAVAAHRHLQAEVQRLLDQARQSLLTSLAAAALDVALEAQSGRDSTPAALSPKGGGA